MTQTRRPTHQRGPDHRGAIGPAQEADQGQQHMGPAATGTHRTTWSKPYRPVRRAQPPAPGEPPRTQRTRTRRTHQQTSAQRRLDAVSVSTYREQAASKQHSRPSRTLRQEIDREGRTPTGRAHVGVAHEEGQPNRAAPRSRSQPMTPTYLTDSHGTSLNTRRPRCGPRDGWGHGAGSSVRRPLRCTMELCRGAVIQALCGVSPAVSRSGRPGPRARSVLGLIRPVVQSGLGLVRAAGPRAWAALWTKACPWTRSSPWTKPVLDHAPWTTDLVRAD